jgi:hypothetical protein
MSEDETKIDGISVSFEDTVLARLEEIGSRLAALEKREQEPETKSVIEPILSEVRNINLNIQTYLKNFDRKLDVVNSELLQVKADQRAVEARLSKVEIETQPQVIAQDKQF